MLPFVEMSLKVDIIKSRYTCPELDTLDFSLWVDIKRRFSSLCSLRRERVLNHALDSVENELDLIQILRKQSAMKLQILEVKSLEKNKDIYSCQLEAEEDADLLQLEAGGTTKAIEDKQKGDYDFREDEEQKGVLHYLAQAMKVMDSNGTPVEIMRNGGRGFGSVWNIIALFLMSAALLAGLLVLGLLEVSGSSTTQTCVPSEGSEFEIVLEKEKFLFRPCM